MDGGELLGLFRGVAILVVKTFRALSGTSLVSSPHARSHHRVRLQALLVSDKQCFLSQKETKRGFPNYQVCGIAPCGGVARESCVSIIDVLKLPFALSGKYRTEYRVGALRLFGEHVQFGIICFFQIIYMLSIKHMEIPLPRKHLFFLKLHVFCVADVFAIKTLVGLVAWRSRQRHFLQVGSSGVELSSPSMKLKRGGCATAVESAFSGVASNYPPC